MHLLDFVLKNSDWEKKLSDAPYYITIKHDGDYVLFKYSIDSDMGLQEVQESRGSILCVKQNKAFYVCRPFKKFFNYGEQYAAPIDWKTAKVSEKIDGSLMKVWFHNGWHLSTNGTIDAFKAPINGTDLTFGEVFEKALGYDVQTLGNYLDKRLTYLFELVSPETRIVVNYPSAAVYYLSAFFALWDSEYFGEVNLPNVLKPHVYDLTNLEDIIKVCNEMNADEEGVVVSDFASHRIKVKSPQYLAAAHFFQKGAIDEEELYELYYNEKIDDFLGYFPEYQSGFDKLKDKIAFVASSMEESWNEVKNFAEGPRAVYAEKALVYRWYDYLFKRLSNNDLSALDYLHSLPCSKAYKIIESVVI